KGVVDMAITTGHRRSTVLAGALSLAVLGVTSPVSADGNGNKVERAAVPEGAIQHVMVIDLENENYDSTFGPNSPAVYLNQTLLKQGQLIQNYFATSHVSLGNYLSQVSGQAPTNSANNDCIDLASLTHPPIVGGSTNVTPGNDAADQARFPGQVVG